MLNEGLRGPLATRTDAATTTTSSAVAGEPPREVRASLTVQHPARSFRTRRQSVVFRGTTDGQGALLLTNIAARLKDRPGGYPDAVVRPDASGRWSYRIRLFKGENAVFVERFPPGVEPKTENGDPDQEGYISRDRTVTRIVRPRTGAPISPQAVRAARSKWLGSLRGLNKSQVRNRVGTPDHTQFIGGQSIWYYDVADNTWQVVFDGETVTEENKY